MKTFKLPFRVNIRPQRLFPWDIRWSGLVLQIFPIGFIVATTWAFKTQFANPAAIAFVVMATAFLMVWTFVFFQWKENIWALFIGTHVRFPKTKWASLKEVVIRENWEWHQDLTHVALDDSEDTFVISFRTRSKAMIAKLSA